MSEAGKGLTILSSRLGASEVMISLRTRESLVILSLGLANLSPLLWSPRRKGTPLRSTSISSTTAVLSYLLFFQ